MTERDPLKELRRVVEAVEKGLHNLELDARYSVRFVTDLIRERIPEAFRD